MRHTNLFVGIAVIAGLVLTLVLFGLSTQSSAQAEADTMAQLINDLWTRVLDEQKGESSSEFTFTIEFKDSVSGVGNSVTLGQGLNTLRLDRVGADYFCLARVFSRNLNNDCISIHNVNKINFREDQ